MKYEVEINKAYTEAKETDRRKLATSDQFFAIPNEELKELGKDCDGDFWIANGLLARSVNDFRDIDYGRRNVNALVRPSGRFGVLYVVDETPCQHKMVKQPPIKQPDKCKKCGWVKG